MLRSSLTCTLILVSLILKAQQDTLSNRIPAQPYIVFSTELLPYLDGANGNSARIGVEYARDQNWSFYIGGGIYFEQGYMIRASAKRSLGEGDRGRYFLTLDYMHMWHVHYEHDYYQKPNGQGDYEPDDSRPFMFREEKNNHVIDVMFEYDEFWRHRLVLQWFGGAGVKFRSAIIGAPDSTLSALYHYHESIIEGGGAVPGSFLCPDLRFGVRLGVVFGRRRRYEP